MLNVAQTRLNPIQFFNQETYFCRLPIRKKLKCTKTNGLETIVVFILASLPFPVFWEKNRHTKVYYIFVAYG